MSDFDEQQALDGLRRLDPQVIGAVFDRHYAELYRFILYRTDDSAASEDLASEVFVKLLEALQAKRAPQTDLKAWLIGTASHLVADHFRRRYRRPQETLPEAAADLGPGPASQVQQREQTRSIRNALEALTDEQQDVLALRFGQGYSLQETAALLKKNINAVKALQFRALAALKRGIGEVDDE